MLVMKNEMSLENDALYSQARLDLDQVAPGSRLTFIRKALVTTHLEQETP